LELFSLSNSTNPVSVGLYTTNAWLSAPIVVSGNYAYTSPWLQVIDVSSPTNPVPVGGDATFPVGLAASGDCLYVADGTLQILCINCPRLYAELLCNQQLLLRWPQSGSNYVLECTGALLPTHWQTVNGTPQVQNGFYTLSMPAI